MTRLTQEMTRYITYYLKEVGFRLFTVTHCHCGVAICHGESRVYTRFFFLNMNSVKTILAPIIGQNRARSACKYR